MTSENLKKESDDLILHSKLNMASYSMSDFIMQIFAFTFSTYVFFFYEAVLGLESYLAGFGFIIYAIWNAVNDPLVGFICDRPFFFTKKWGRRFPWIISSMFPSIFVYVLLFSPPLFNPVTDQLAMFAWLIFSTCLFDTAASFWGVNSSALFPDKFRGIDERRSASGIRNLFGYLGIAVGALLPPFIVDYAVKQSFIDQAWALILIAIVAGMLAIPGLREDQENIDRYLQSYEDDSIEREKIHFFKTFISTFKQKNFVAFVILFLSYSILRACLLGSLQYGLLYILVLDSKYSTILSAGYLIASLASIPLWVKLIKKKNDNRKIMIYGAIVATVFTLPMVFLADLISWIIILMLWGVGISGMFIAIYPVFADIIDENVVKTKVRKEGLYNGFYAFITRFSIVAQALIFATVHILTGFEEGALTQEPLAIIGIQIAMALIPSIIMVIGTIIFWKYYDITPEKSAIIQEQLKELNL